MQSQTETTTKTTETASADELRQRYLTFFEGKGHLIYPSAPLKSRDPGLLFNVAGMQQFKPYFQGELPKFPGFQGVHRRVVSSQKCLRAGGKDSDIENVGRTRRHHTFFEMLGNFSFGAYFKREAILWAWEFLTSEEWLGLPPERLYVTVFSDDDEAYDIWKNEVGIPEARLSRWGEAENFWPANAISDEREGPCGPCSEIFYDRGPDYGSEDEVGPNTGSGDRFIEIWNLVFTQFDLQPDGELKPLPQKNIDTGMGLERLVTLVSGAPDAYATSLFQPIIQRIVKLSGVPYEDLGSIHHRVIADHLRAVTFAICDGIPPANDGAGYVIKMLTRRASRQAYLLGLREPVLHELVSGVVEAMGAAYPELKDAQKRIEGIIHGEEEQFLRTLESGTARVQRLLDELKGETVPGEVAFDLWETYGFPLDLTVDMAAERGLTVDRAGFEAARQRAREASRGAQERGALFGKSALGELVGAYGESEFVGYSTLEVEVKVVALLREGERLEAVKESEHTQVILDRTPFYAEGGGQIGDSGILEWPGGKAAVSTTAKSGGVYVHQAYVLRGALEPGQQVRAVVDPSRRETEKHHSATHLLHAALRSVLGTHVAQAGSLVTPARLRFDFSHSRPLTDEEILAVETLVNRWIQADFAVNWKVVPIAEAKAQGAMMLFGEKYGEQVRLVQMGDDQAALPGLPSVAPQGLPSVVSKELCGGTHVRRTGEIGSLIITTEEAVSAGVRRVTALCGMAALHHYEALRADVGETARALGSSPEELPKRAAKLQDELKAAQKENAKLRDKLAAAQTSSPAATQVRAASGFRYATGRLEGLDTSALRNAADTLLQRSGADFVALASSGLLVVKASKEAQAKGFHAGNFIRELAQRAGGGGGGRGDMAQAGVKDLDKLPTALDAIPEILEGLGD